MVRLRTVSASSRGWTRRRAGRGFVYLDADGERLAPEDVRRVKDLVIPPAWEDVWICPQPNGHLQAVGVDAAGRRQYLYHPEWRVRRDLAKYDRVLEVVRKLPRARKAMALHLALEGMPRERAAATAVRLLDLGYFRIGSDSYTDSFGLTTLRREHVRRRRDGALEFCFVGKSGVEHCYEDGTTIESAVRRSYPDPAARQAALERATLRMLRNAPESWKRARRAS